MCILFAALFRPIPDRVYQPRNIYDYKPAYISWPSTKAIQSRRVSVHSSFIAYPFLSRENIDQVDAKLPLFSSVLRWLWCYFRSFECRAIIVPTFRPRVFQFVTIQFVVWLMITSIETTVLWIFINRIVKALESWDKNSSFLKGVSFLWSSYFRILIERSWMYVSMVLQRGVIFLLTDFVILLFLQIYEFQI